MHLLISQGLLSAFGMDDIFFQESASYIKIILTYVNKIILILFLSSHRYTAAFPFSSALSLLLSTFISIYYNHTRHDPPIISLGVVLPLDSSNNYIHSRQF